VWGGLFDSGILTGCGYLEKIKFERISGSSIANTVMCGQEVGVEVKWGGLLGYMGQLFTKNLHGYIQVFRPCFRKLGPQGLWQIQSLGLWNFGAKNTFKSCEKMREHLKATNKHSLKVPLSHDVQLTKSTPIILELSLLHKSLGTNLHSNSMSGNEWKVMFGHNTSHFGGWNRDVCNAPTSLNYPRNLASFVWNQHKCN
jgi:hypothetical protein